jgi:hypothetical protein
MAALPAVRGRGNPYAGAKTPYVKKPLSPIEINTLFAVGNAERNWGL